MSIKRQEIDKNLGGTTYDNSPNDSPLPWPMEQGFVVNDIPKVTSAYTKDSNPVQYFQNSEILHADEKRTIPLLRSIGFHMPIELQQSGSIGSISYISETDSRDIPGFNDFRKRNFGRLNIGKGRTNIAQASQLLSGREYSTWRKSIQEYMAAASGAAKNSAKPCWSWIPWP